MPRSIKLSVSSRIADDVVDRIATLDGVVGLERRPGVSIDPPGDVVEVLTTNDGARRVLEQIDTLRAAAHGSVVATMPSAVVAGKHQHRLDAESNEGVWEEMALLMQSGSNVKVNYLAQMAIAGAAAAAGLWADMLHIVIGSMLIAPAFEPLIRMPFGWASGMRLESRTGALSALTGYAALAGGAFIALLFLRMVDPAGGELSARTWVGYWTTFSAPGVLASVLGAVAGGITIAGIQSVFTTGVMVLLALVPSMAIVGMGVADLDFALAGRGLVRWAVDAALVVLASALVLAWKAKAVHRRRVSAAARDEG